MSTTYLLKTSAGMLWGTVFCVVLGLSACSSSQGTQPGPSEPSAPALRESIKPDVRPAQTPGSLEALRRGEAPVTPKDSPLKEIYFDFDKYDLRPDARATLKANAEWLKKNPGVRVEIEGHCDERGTTEYNLGLGARRANAAKDYLVSLGVPAARVSTTSYGEEAPACREHNEECWQRNRRDRFVARAEKPGV